MRFDDPSLLQMNHLGNKLSRLQVSTMAVMKMLVPKPVRDLVASQDLLWNLTLRELRGKYRRSFLGWTWSLLNPLALVGIYWFVFSVVFGSQPPIGNPSGIKTYALYLLCALLPWSFFNLITGLGMSSLLGNGGLVRTVAFPRQTLVFAQSIFSLVQFTIEMTLLTVILLFAGSPLLHLLPLTMLQMLLLACFSTGIALALSVMLVYFRDLTYLWTIINQVYFFMTPIIYDPSLLEDKATPLIRSLLRWNPMSVFVDAFRKTMYDGRAPAAANIAGLFAAAALSMAFGLLVFSRGVRRLAEEV